MSRRRPGRTKSYVAERFDLESSESEPESAVRARRLSRNKAHDDDDKDADFAAADEDGEHQGDDDDGDDDDDGGGDDEAPDSLMPDELGLDLDLEPEQPQPPQPPPQPSQRRAKKPSAKALIAHRARLGLPVYRELEPVPSDSHAVKSYVGAYGRHLRAQTLVKIWYGPEREAIAIVQRIISRWMAWAVLPPRTPPPDAGPAESHALPEKDIWLSPGAADKEAELARRWRAELPTPSVAASTILTESAAAPYVLPDRALAVLMGPYPAQRVVNFRPGHVVGLSRAGLPLEQAGSHEAEAAGGGDEEVIGYMFDSGGIVVGMDWAPRSQHHLAQSQLLALAVIPHADQEMYDYETEHRKPDFERRGLVQLWALGGERLSDGTFRPSTRHRPRLCRRLCFDCGRARKLRWSPAGGHLAVLCGDGAVRVVDIGDQDTDGAYERVDEPVATLALLNEYGVKATAMAWATFNRLAVGYSDGSLALWSVHPARLLGRHPVHHSDVTSVATGAPTMPYLVASSPLGGSVKLVDVRSPAYETTEVQTNAVNSQPNMLAWSDHSLGFFTAYPSANALNTMVGFVHHRHFPIVRRIFTGENYLSCLAVGRTHPFLLVGSSDGTLWGLNPQCELFKARRPAQDRIRIFQHEHRPPGLMPQGSPAPERGASRILHGFAQEKNLHAMSDGRAAKRAAKKGKKKDDDSDDEEAVDDDAGGGEEPFSLVDPTRGIVHEPLTRVTAVEWNPNLGFGCWAAAALGSGLVRVLNLGLEVVV